MEILNYILLVLLVLSAAVALQVKDLVSAALVFGIFSFLACLCWAVMGAVDVAFTEAAVGAGVSAMFLLGTIFHTKRHSSD